MAALPENNRNCKTCLVTKPITDYYSTNSGYRRECKRCSLDKMKIYAEANKDRRKVYMNKWLEDNREYNKAKCIKRYQNNKQEYKDRANEWKILNPEKNKASYAKSAKIHKVKNRSRLKAIKVERLNRIPKWLTADDWLKIDSFYELAEQKMNQTGIKYHVDHIIPLKGKNVSGLHVPSNLQVLTAKENIKKGNKFEGID